MLDECEGHQDARREPGRLFEDGAALGAGDGLVAVEAGLAPLGLAGVAQKGVVALGAHAQNALLDGLEADEALGHGLFAQEKKKYPRWDLNPQPFD
jgi:hypothetical protein